MDLKTYIEKKKLEGTSAAKIASEIGISSSYLGEIASGEKMPRPKKVRLIEKGTHGHVRLDDMVKFYEQHQSNTPSNTPN